jgi:hypothetical protein
MTKSRSRAAALPGLTAGTYRNDEGARSFQGKHQTEEHAESKAMLPSPVFEMDGAKTYIRRVAFVLATLPLFAAVALMMKSIF